jgi:hypothetical protein
MFQADLVACGQQTTSRPLTKNRNPFVGMKAQLLDVEHLCYACTSCHAGRCWTWHWTARNSPRIPEFLVGSLHSLHHQRLHCSHHHHRPLGLRCVGAPQQIIATLKSGVSIIIGGRYTHQQCYMSNKRSPDYDLGSDEMIGHVDNEVMKCQGI